MFVFCIRFQIQRIPVSVSVHCGQARLAEQEAKQEEEEKIARGSKDAEVNEAKPEKDAQAKAGKSQTRERKVKVPEKEGK